MIDMDRKELAIAAIVIFIAIIVGAVLFAPSNEAESTTIAILNKGDFGENSSVYVKLTDWQKNALDNKTVHIQLTNNKGKVVFDKSVKTHTTGVAIAQLENVSAGDYNLSASFDGDEGYQKTSASKKISLKEDNVTDEVDDSDLVSQTITDTSPRQSSSSHQQTSHTQSSQSQSSKSSDSDSSEGTYIDENGKTILNEYDENGKLVDPTAE